jgi:hypothetical protein
MRPTFVAAHSYRLEAVTQVWNQFPAGVCDAEEVTCRVIQPSVAYTRRAICN